MSRRARAVIRMEGMRLSKVDPTAPGPQGPKGPGNPKAPGTQWPREPKATGIDPAAWDHLSESALSDQRLATSKHLP